MPQEAGGLSSIKDDVFRSICDKNIPVIILNKSRAKATLTSKVYIINN
jgi:hypothetical protein